ncbi:MAG: hypothetical protein AW07_02119 [Candidatus Accumulibacter sp. SK-11]|nr:MAG: hypothetical protein AW07_02119 [Candidatus Accumulibacter sp. SK-11]
MVESEGVSEFVNVDLEGVLANLRRHQIGIGAVEPDAADRRIVGMGVADAGTRGADLDVRVAGGGAYEVGSDQVVPGLQGPLGGCLLHSIEADETGQLVVAAVHAGGCRRKSVGDGRPTPTVSGNQLVENLLLGPRCECHIDSFCRVDAKLEEALDQRKGRA